MRARASFSFVAAVIGLALLPLTGCTGSEDRPGAAETPDAPPVRSSTPNSTPVTSPTTPGSEVTSADPTPEDTPLADRLVPTAQVPALSPQAPWQDGDTGKPTTDPFGLCAQTAPGADLLSIGATDVVARTYYPADDSDDSAAEQVAEFPDARTASTAWTVLAAWHRRCGKKLSSDNHLKVGPLAPVSVEGGTARWYLLSWSPPEEEVGQFEAFGMVLSGTRIAVLRMDHSGQDHDYPPGRDPMMGMVRAAAGWLR